MQIRWDMGGTYTPAMTAAEWRALSRLRPLPLPKFIVFTFILALIFCISLPPSPQAEIIGGKVEKHEKFGPLRSAKALALFPFRCVWGAARLPIHVIRGVHRALSRANREDRQGGGFEAEGEGEGVTGKESEEIPDALFIDESELSEVTTSPPSVAQHPAATDEKPSFSWVDKIEGLEEVKPGDGTQVPLTPEQEEISTAFEEKLKSAVKNYTELQKRLQKQDNEKKTLASAIESETGTKFNLEDIIKEAEEKRRIHKEKVERYRKSLNLTEEDEIVFSEDVSDEEQTTFSKSLEGLYRKMQYIESRARRGKELNREKELKELEERTKKLDLKPPQSGDRVQDLIREAEPGGKIIQFLRNCTTAAEKKIKSDELRRKHYGSEPVDAPEPKIELSPEKEREILSTMGNAVALRKIKAGPYRDPFPTRANKTGVRKDDLAAQVPKTFNNFLKLYEQREKSKRGLSGEKLEKYEKSRSEVLEVITKILSLKDEGEQEKISQSLTVRDYNRLAKHIEDLEKYKLPKLSQSFRDDFEPEISESDPTEPKVSSEPKISSEPTESSKPAVPPESTEPREYSESTEPPEPRGNSEVTESKGDSEATEPRGASEATGHGAWVYAKVGGDGVYHVARIKSKMRVDINTVTRRWEQPWFIINGFYNNMRKSFVQNDAVCHFWIIKWPNSAFDWKAFRESFLGATDPSKASPGSLRHEFYRNWKSLGLASEPGGSENAVHGSASALESLFERENWLSLPYDTDPLGRALLSEGVPLETLRSFSRDPSISVPGVNPGDSQTVTSVFDMMENKGTQGCFDTVLSLSNITSNGKIIGENFAKENIGFLFLKPHAVTEPARRLVTAKIRDWGAVILDEGEINGAEIRDKRIIDRHYFSIADKSLIQAPSRLHPDPKRLEGFLRKFEISWGRAVKSGYVFNSMEAESALSLSPDDISNLWDKAKDDGQIVKLGGGFYVARVEPPEKARGFRLGDFSETPIWVEWRGIDFKVKSIDDIRPSGEEINLLAGGAKGDIQVITREIQKGVFVDATDPHERTALYGAAANGHLDAVKELIKLGASVEAKNSQGITPLYIAVQNNRSKVVECLIATGADIGLKTQTGTTPLHVAGHKGFTAIIKSLLRAGADVNARRRDFATPIFLAMQGGHLEAFKTLAKNGASLEWEVTEDNGDSEPVSTLIGAARFGRRDIVQYLVRDMGMDPNRPVGNLMAFPLAMAAQFGHSECVRVLIENGADPNLRFGDKFTPLGLAAKYGRVEAAKTLLENGADPDLVACGENNPTALIVASVFNHPKIGEILLEYGADIDSKTSAGLTPLMSAVQAKKREMIHFLLENKADPNERDFKGKSAFQIAQLLGDKVAMSMLRQAGAVTDG